AHRPGAGKRMKEATWLDGGTPQAMLRFLKGRAGERKLRLFAVAVHRESRRSQPEFATPAALLAAERAEEVADGGAPVDTATWHKMGGYFVLNPTGFGAARRLGDNSDVPDEFKCALLRCLFGNPFRPAVADPGWLSPTVVAIATATYAERAFDRLPV